MTVDWASSQAFVIAKGRGYLIDTSTRELIHQASDDLLQDAVFLPARGVFVVADELRLTVFQRGAPLWSTGRLSWDGIRRLEARGATVAGDAWKIGGKSEEDSWSPFTLDLDSRRVAGATYDGPGAVYVVPRSGDGS